MYLLYSFYGFVVNIVCIVCEYVCILWYCVYTRPELRYIYASQLHTPRFDPQIGVPIRVPNELFIKVSVWGVCSVVCVYTRPNYTPPCFGCILGYIVQTPPVNSGILWVSMVVLSVLSPILWVFYGFLCISGEKIVFLVVLDGIFFSLNRSV